MTTIGNRHAAASLNLQTVQAKRDIARGLTIDSLQQVSTPSSDELREHFNQFVGQTFFGQMIKAMRATVDKPAYFHGGQGEEVFRSQLDQTLAEHMTTASADRFAEPMFERQFPHLAEQAVQAKGPQSNPTLNALSQLSRR